MGFLVFLVLVAIVAFVWARKSRWRALASRQAVSDTRSDWEETPLVFTLNGCPYVMSRLGASNSGLQLSSVIGPMGWILFHPRLMVPWRKVAFKGETPDLEYYEIDIDGETLQLRGPKLYNRLLNAKKVRVACLF